jgi:hypothetical protein
MKAYAEDAERLASEQGISLDYTEEGLERIDLLLYQIAGDTVRGHATGSEQNPL